MKKETGLVISQAAQQLVHMVKGTLTTTSLIVAEEFKKQHKHVLEAIEKLGCPEDFSGPNFRPGSYFDAQSQSRPMYEMTKDGFTLLAMGFTGKKAMEFKLKFLAAFNCKTSIAREEAAVGQVKLLRPQDF